MNAKNNITKYKETIDYIYRATCSDRPQRIEPGAGWGSVGNYIIRDLIKRNILTKTDDGGFPKRFLYQWNPRAMAPTNTLYKNVANSVRAFIKSERLRREAQKKDEPIVEPPQAVVESNPPQEKSHFLAQFNDAELLDELKDRGWQIKDGRLARVTTIYFD